MTYRYNVTVDHDMGPTWTRLTPSDLRTVMWTCEARDGTTRSRPSTRQRVRSVGSWVGPWVRFDKMTRRQAIETAEILLEQRDKQIRRAEAAEARLAELPDDLASLGYQDAAEWLRVANRVVTALRGEGDRPAEVDRTMQYIAERDAELLRRLGEGDRA